MLEWRVLFTFVDRDMNEAQTRLHLPKEQTFASVQTKALSLASLMSSLSDAKLVRMAIVSTEEYEYAEVPAVGSDVGRVGFFAVRYTNGDYGYSLVPSIRQELELLDMSGRRTWRLSADAPNMLVFTQLLQGTVNEYKRVVDMVITRGIIK